MSSSSPPHPCPLSGLCSVSYDHSLQFFSVISLPSLAFSAFFRTQKTSNGSEINFSLDKHPNLWVLMWILYWNSLDLKSHWERLPYKSSSTWSFIKRIISPQTLAFLLLILGKVKRQWPLFTVHSLSFIWHGLCMIRKLSRALRGTQTRIFFSSFSKDLLDAYYALEVQKAGLYFNLHEIILDLFSINIFDRLYTSCDLKLDWKRQNCYCISLPTTFVSLSRI